MFPLDKIEVRFLGCRQMCRQSGSISNLSSFLFLITALLTIISLPHAVQGYEKTHKSEAANFSGPQLSWEIITIDSGAYAEQNSIAIDSKDKVHIAYTDETNPAGPALKYATNASGSWVISYIDQGTVVGGLDNIAIDLNDKVHIVYYDGAKGQVKYGTNASGSWVTSILDDSFYNMWAFVAIDSHNKVHISYLTYDNCLKYATNASGSWVISTIDTFEASAAATSIALDSNDKIHITYQTASGSTVYFKYATNAAGSWVTDTIDWYDIGFAYGSFHSIVVDSNNRPHVLYTNRATDELTCATNSSGSWVKSIIDNGGYTWGGGPSMAIDSNDALHICYFIEIPVQSNTVTLGDLKYGTNASGAWATYTVDNIGFAPSIAVDSNNKVHIAYCGIGNNGLKYATNSAPTQYTLTISKSGTGSGTITSAPPGISCGSTCQANFTTGTNVTLTASADAGSTFTGWSGGGCSGTDPCTIALNSDTTVVASFGLSGNCAYTISPTNKTFNAKGGSVSIKVSATGQTNCPAATVGEDAEWISVSGTPTWKANKGTVKIAVQQNPSSQSRTGIVSIGGENLTIGEDGAICQLTAVKPSSGKYPNTGGSGSFDITVSPKDCGWNVATTFDWIHLDTTTGTGNGTAAFHLDANGTGKSRTGKIDVSPRQNVTKKRRFTVNENK